MEKRQLVGKLAWAASLGVMLVLSACNAPGNTPASVSADPPTPTPTLPVVSPPPSAAGDAGRACRSDSDCAIKDAGSCCGYRPACVNKDTPTFPEKVQAQCAQDGRVGICGFPAIDGCQCVAGKCEGSLMMENSVPLQ